MTRTTKPRRSEKPRTMIPVDEAVARWRKDPAYMAEYDALEQEFALVAEVIKARAKSGLTQEQLAKRMNTSQAVVARLESGRTLPSTRTLKRFAEATGHRLKISFEPEPA
jgi:ribosome-binding protein aMBF1 (putative translation factor)